MRSAAPAGDSGNAVERLQDEQWHILELLDTHARHRRDPQQRAAEASRLAGLIYTLLRVHCDLEALLLDAALRQQPQLHARLAGADARRSDMLEALDRCEALSPRDPAHGAAMARLAQCVRDWFQQHEGSVFAALRRSGLDLQALDRQMAARQEALLSAGRNAVRPPAARAPRAVTPGRVLPAVG